VKGLGILIILGVMSQSPPPPASPAAAPRKQTHQERRAEILRTMQEMRAKLQALELELQLLEEEKQSAPVEATTTAGSQTGWRETTRPDGRRDEEAVKKARPRCAAFTSNGKRCTRSAETGSKYCWQHRH